MSTDITSYLASQPASQVVSSSGATGTAADLASGQSNLATSFSSFLTLLTTQLQNQDPTSPLDPNQFTQQLVQMTGVQQQLLSNQLLQSLVNQSQGGQGLSSAVGLIGKTVTAQSSSATLQNGSAQWQYELDGTAANATLAVSDSTGRTIWSGAAPSTDAGDHTFTWNGMDSNGQPVAAGNYTLSVTATDATGTAVTNRIFVQGVVGSLAESNGQTLVTVGATQTPLSTITGVNAS